MNIPMPRVRSSASVLPVAMAVALTLVAGVDGRLFGQAEVKVDFARDVQPLLKERCVGCHGPSQQMSGYRLDRRSTALGGVLRANIVPGSSESSRLYRKLIGSQFGPQMPPTGVLAPDEIDILKRWIDGGADWPEALANEADLPAQDPAATRLTELIRVSDRQAVLEHLKRKPSAVNGRGPGGSTPLMYAAIYGDADLVAEMLRAGADPNLRNHAGASALMWALDDVEKVRVLLKGGADVKVTSGFGRTPLTVASAQAGSAPVVELLLERGAAASQAALTSAARSNAAVVRLLLAAGARDTGEAAIAALRANCRECLDAIVGHQPSPMRGALLSVLAPAGPGNPDAVREAIERGADVTVKDQKSRTVLMMAAVSEKISPELVQLLIERGADVQSKDPDGLSALDFARRLGHTPVVDVLAGAGATMKSEADPTLTFVTGNSIRTAVERSLPLLQRTSVQFYKKSGCVSCHHNSMTEMTVAAARLKGFAVDENSARQDLSTVVKDIEASRDQALQGIVIPGGFVTTTGYILMGLSAERHQSDAATDALVRLLKVTQRPDGRWSSTYRPPLEASEFTATAVSLRGLQLYGRTEWQSTDNAIRAAASWLENAQPQSTEDRVFRLFGLTWAGASDAVRQSGVRDLVATQQSDGGWAQLPSLRTDAYATGEALVALREAGVATDDPVYRKGVQFLLTTQLADGSWFVRTRAHPTQVFFDSGFPHRTNQYISTAATNWATLALIAAR